MAIVKIRDHSYGAYDGSVVTARNGSVVTARNGSVVNNINEVN